MYLVLYWEAYRRRQFFSSINDDCPLSMDCSTKVAFSDNVNDSENVPEEIPWAKNLARFARI